MFRHVRLHTLQNLLGNTEMFNIFLRSALIAWSKDSSRRTKTSSVWRNIRRIMARPKLVAREGEEAERLGLKSMTELWEE